MKRIESSFRQELLIVIVIYKQKISETTAFKTLNPIRDGATVFIYDNSPLPQQPPFADRIIYHHDEENPGVSKAYNTAATQAKMENKSWLLFVDQDTSFPESFLSTYRESIERFPDSGLFVPFVKDRKGILSPFIFRQGKGKRLSRSPRAGSHDLGELRIINSGILISLNLFEASGGYDERFRLDYSDIVFTDRLLNIHPEFILVDNIVIQEFSGTSTSDLNSTVERFQSFCSSLILYKNICADVPLNWVLLSRALKLSLQTANFQFLKIAVDVLRRI